MRGHADKKLYVSAQMLGLMGIIPVAPDLSFYPNSVLQEQEARQWIRAAVSYQFKPDQPVTISRKIQSEPTAKGTFFVLLHQEFCKTSPAECTSAASTKPTYSDVCGQGSVFKAVDFAARRKWVWPADISQTSPAPRRVCNGSFQRNGVQLHLASTKPIKRSEAAKILWNFVFREKLGDLQPTGATPSAVSASVVMRDLNL